jgi:hypothetical protein
MISSLLPAAITPRNEHCTEPGGAHIGIGRKHAGRAVLILVKDLHVTITTSTGDVLRDCVLDPTRDYQPNPRT